MATEYSFGRVITQDLVLSLDAADRNSYPTTGLTWKDLSGNSINGTLDSGTSYSSEAGGSMVFDGTDDNITLGSPSILDLPSFTQEVVYRPIAIDRRNVIIGDNNPSGADATHAMWMEHYLDNSLILIFGDGTTPGTRISTVKITDTTKFHHIICCRNATSKTIEFYVNGVSDGSMSWQNLATIGAPVSYGPPNEYSYVIGKTAFASGNFSCPVIRMYNRVLTQDEILKNFNSQKSRFGI